MALITWRTYGCQCEDARRDDKEGRRSEIRSSSVILVFSTTTRRKREKAIERSYLPTKPRGIGSPGR